MMILFVISICSLVLIYSVLDNDTKEKIKSYCVGLIKKLLDVTQSELFSCVKGNKPDLGKENNILKEKIAKYELVIMKQEQYIMNLEHDEKTPSKEESRNLFKLINTKNLHEEL